MRKHDTDNGRPGEPKLWQWFAAAVLLAIVLAIAGDAGARAAGASVRVADGLGRTLGVAGLLSVLVLRDMPGMGWRRSKAWPWVAAASTGSASAIVALTHALGW